jgi:DNA-binding protein H-NS
MAKMNGLEKLSYAELAELRQRIVRLMAQKEGAERSTVRERISAFAKQHGFEVRELIDGRRKAKGKGKRGGVAIKYRDPKNPENTWTGRGRTPRWMVAALKGGKAKKEDFLI